MIRSLSDLALRRMGPSGKIVQVIAGPDENGFSKMLAGVTTLARGQRSGPAAHESEEFYLILDGTARVELGGHHQIVEAESVVAIGPGVSHCLEAVSDAVRYLWVLAPPGTDSVKKLRSTMADVAREG